MSQPAAAFSIGELVLVAEENGHILGIITDHYQIKNPSHKYIDYYSIEWSDGFNGDGDHQHGQVLLWRNDYLNWCDANNISP